ncbi:MAG TPA: ion channel, partial [Candidatus Limnocylindrales bacterium]|nr:ion channel [Candidatus Limnocylindrales bacterium]
MISALSGLLGIVLVGLVGWDLFQTVVVPRPSPGRLRIARWVVRGSWRAVKATGRRLPAGPRDALFGLYGPAVAIALLAIWLLVLTLGFGLVLFAIRDQVTPSLPDVGSAVYFAASSVLTLGYGDFVPGGPVARLLVAVAAAGGLGAVALVVTFLFSLYGSYQRREVAIVALQATAGAPPSAVALLET